MIGLPLQQVQVKKKKNPYREKRFYKVRPLKHEPHKNFFSRKKRKLKLQTKNAT